MLQSLHIKNYAIIKELHLAFSEGFNVITGETGAGKSILMGALNLILGARAESNVLLDQDKKCIVEANFKLKSSDSIKEFFQENDIDYSAETIVRREIAPNGKSRAFINDFPVNLNLLKELGSLLVDLHQQFDTAELGSLHFQRTVLDALANNSTLIEKYQSVFKKYQSTENELKKLIEEKSQIEKEKDYNQFLFDELDEIDLKENELEQTEAELKILNNAEEIKTQIAEIINPLSNNDEPILQLLKSLNNKLQNILEVDSKMPEIQSRFKSSLLELQEVVNDLEQVDASIQFDPEKIQILNDRLSAGFKLLKKHGVTTTAELIQIKNQLNDQLQIAGNLDSRLENLQKELDELKKSATKIASEISSKRKSTIAPFEKNVQQLLHQVGMPNAQIKIEMSDVELNQFGMDQVQYLFNANKNRFEPLQKVASGGELSRLMLSIKSLVAGKLELPTLIFDEIDTGISGEAAIQVGAIMKQLSNKHQLIVISHQPQIAAKADEHFYVYKKEIDGIVQTDIQVLKKEERINAIARMLGGNNPSKTVLANAAEMVN